ncbi:MAG: guanylate kinase [Pseudomonadota bacterium]
MGSARTGLLIILSSPSGAGKSTLARRLMAWDESISFSVSATTRPPREGEVDGKDYYFRTAEEFEAMVAAGDMLEHAQVFSNRYGSPRGPVAAAIADGRDVLFDVDWQGGQQISRSDLSAYVVSIFILPPSIKELHGRLKERGTDSAEVVANRMKKARDEISHFDGYDYVLVNDDLDQCSAQLHAIIEAERLRLNRQPGVMDKVRGLNSEFEEIQDAF